MNLISMYIYYVCSFTIYEKRLSDSSRTREAYNYYSDSFFTVVLQTVEEEAKQEVQTTITSLILRR